jgi:hypothetical protein
MDDRKSRRFSIRHASKSLANIILFLGSIAIYASSRRLPSVGDTIPASIWLFNFLEHHSLTFNNLPENVLMGGIGNYFLRRPGGDWITIYPITTAIITAPIYALFYLHAKLVHYGAAIDLLTPAFESQRLIYEKIAASILASGSIVLLFSILKRRFKSSIALITTIIFGFATTTWTISSQSLWQHGIVNLMLLGSIWSILKAQESSDGEGNHSSLANRFQQFFQGSAWFITLAGICCGFLLGARPTSILYLFPLLGYILITQFRNMGFFAIGLLSYAPILWWNFHYFGSWIGGYATIPGFNRLDSFWTAFPGILLSPSRGVLVYSPILIFAIPGCILLIKGLKRSRQVSVDRLFLGLFAVSAVIVSSYFSVTVWWAGWSYGPRFLTDALPAFCLMIGYFVEFLTRKMIRSYWQTVCKMMFTAIMIFSMGTQVLAIGLTDAAGDWNAFPYSVNLDISRLWDWRDSPISRYWHALHYQSFSRQINNSRYVSSFSGEISGINIEEKHERQSDGTIVIPRATLKHLTIDELGLYRQYVTLHPQILNSSKELWYGYRSGLSNGIVAVHGKLFTANNDLIGSSYFYLAEQCKPQNMGDAIGLVILPLPDPNKVNSAVTYRLVLELQLHGHPPLPEPSYTLTLKIL